MDSESTIRHTIVVEALPRLEDLVAGHNRRVARLLKRHSIVIAPATLKTVRTFQKDCTVEGGVQVQRWFAEVEISAQRAQISGWEIVGSFVSTDAGFLFIPIKGVSAGIDFEPFRARGGQCDHCKAARSRSVTYILRQISGGQLKLVGSACLKDFTGHLAPSAWAMYADSLVRFEDEMDELGGEDEGRGHGGCGQQAAVSLQEYLGYAAMLIRQHGWISKSKAWESRNTNHPERATAVEAWERLQIVQNYRKIIAGIQAGGTEEQLKQRAVALLESFSTDGKIDPAKLGCATAEQVLVTEAGIRAKFQEDDRIQAAKLTTDMEAAMPAPEDVSKAAEDLDFVAESFEAKSDRSDYEDHLLTVIHQGFAFERNTGMAASICAAADRIRIDRIREAAKKAEKDEWFGAEGKREAFVLRCIYTQLIDGAWGSSTLHIFLDKEGRKAKWFSSSERLEKGAYEIKATVKKHETYEGRKVTQLVRCKIVRRLSDEAMQCPF